MKVLFYVFCGVLVLNVCAIRGATVDSNTEDPDDDGINLDDRILNGQIAKPQAFPFQVSLQEDLPRSYSKFCGGVILNKRWILTAAHCYDDVSASAPHRLSKDYRINAGIVDAYDHGGTSQYVKVQSIFKHPQYDDKRFTNDICLLHLASPLKYNKYVRPIALPLRGYEPKGSGTIVGWGAIDHAERVSSRVLRYARIPVSKRSICTEFYDLPQNAICLGGGKTEVNACAGDSGGPFVQKLKGRLRVAGVTSFGSVGCREHEPIVYTKVSAYLDFIYNTIKQNTKQKTGVQTVSKTGIEHPYVVAIMDTDSENNENTKLCTGTILDELWVLTAADCFDNIGISSKDKIKVKIGTNDLDNPSSGELLDIESFYRHKDYNLADTDLKNDVALIKLKKRLNFDSQNVMAAFLPPNYFDINNYQGSILGWKDTFDTRDPLAEVTHDFLSVNVTNADPKECKKLYPNFSDAHLCLKRTGSECNDDPGAPLVVTKGSAHFVIGINSVVNKNCDNNKPFLVTNVLEYLSVLTNIMSTH